MNYPRLALIGCGAVVEQFHLPALKKVGWKPSFFIDPNLDRAKTMAKSLNGMAEADYKAVIMDFDTAIISTPHALHAPISIDLLRNGKYVFVEKPMAPTESECNEMIAAAQKGNAKLAVGLFRRYLKGAQWIKAFINSGSLGKIETFDFREGFVYAWPVTSNSFWQKEKARGGVLMDTGAHTLDLLIWWLGKAESVEYMDDSYDGVEADCIINLSLKSGAKGVVELSRTRTLRGSAIIKGSKGTIEINLTSNEIKAEPHQLLEQMHNGQRGNNISPQSHNELFLNQLIDWLNAIEKGTDPFVTGAEGTDSIVLIDQCYKVRKLWKLPWVEPNIKS
jgi:predicted dehydrogenase